jgi:hypothetical protein
MTCSKTGREIDCGRSYTIGFGCLEPKIKDSGLLLLQNLSIISYEQFIS